MIHLQQQDVEAVAEEFRQEFADADDLVDLSPAALRLLAHAAALFHASGAVATSVRDITGSCGQTPGALYRHFESKDELLYRLVCHGHERLERRIAGALAGADTPVDRVAAFVRGYVSGHLASPRSRRSCGASTCTSTTNVSPRSSSGGGRCATGSRPCCEPVSARARSTSSRDRTARPARPSWCSTSAAGRATGSTRTAARRSDRSPSATSRPRCASSAPRAR